MGFSLKGLLRLAITLNPICNCGTAEGTIHYLHFPKFWNERPTLFHKFQNIVENIVSKNDSNILNVLKHSFNDVKKYFCFNCFNWIHNFSKAFWCFLVSKLALIYLFMCSLFLVFIKNFFVHFFLFSFVFSILTIGSDKFVKKSYYYVFPVLVFTFMYFSWTCKSCSKSDDE